MLDAVFWLYTSAADRPVTLHRLGCGLLRRVNYRTRWTGPLSWDDLAIIPVESYAPCRACMACRKSAEVMTDPKQEARKQARQAERMGWLKPQPCRDCGQTDRHVLQKHHPDYSRQLDIVWLCTKCHQREHDALNRPVRLLERRKGLQRYQETNRIAVEVAAKLAVRAEREKRRYQDRKVSRHPQVTDIATSDAKYGNPLP